MGNSDIEEYDDPLDQRQSEARSNQPTPVTDKTRFLAIILLIMVIMELCVILFMSG